MSSYIAGKMASQKVEGMLEPLLSDDSPQVSDASSKEETVEQTKMEKLKALAVYVGLGMGVVASAAAMVVKPEAAIVIMGGLCIANVPYAAHKERKIGKLPTLRSTNNKLREDANNLEAQVDVLSETIDALVPEADRAASVEQELKGIAARQGVNVNKFVDLVKENGVIQVQMRENLREKIVQDMIAIVVHSDSDNDLTIDKMEGRLLALKIKVTLHEYDVEFDTMKFLEVIGENASVEGVIGIVLKLLPVHKPRKDGDDSDTYGEYEDSDEEDDRYDMFHMVEGSNRSLASGASGGGVSLMKREKKKLTRRMLHKVQSKRRKKSGLQV